MKLQFTPGKTGKFLVTAVLSFTLIGIAVQLCKYTLKTDYLFGLIPLFDLSGDLSIPAWYQSATILLCSVLLAVISIAKKEEEDTFASHWRGLAAVFLYLSIDEAAGIHETIGETLNLKVTGETHGLLHYTWVIFGASLALVIAVAYIKFLRHLPVKTMWLFILSGAIYVGGAIGVEMINARYDEIYGNLNLTYQLMTVVEECFEMVGIALFIYTLMSYIAAENPEMQTTTIYIGEKDYADEA